MKSKTLQQFANNLNAYLKAHPEHAALPVLSASDDEGNDFNHIYYDPTHNTYELRNGDEIEGICIN